MAWTQKLPSGNHRALYRTADKKVRSAGSFPHKSKALAMATMAEVAAAEPGWRDPKAAARTWGAWCKEWWPTRSVAPGTLDRQMSARRKHLEPKWGKTALVDITRHEVKAWAADLARTGLAPTSVQRLIHLLSASLAAAVDAEIIPANPAARLNLPHGETDVHRYLTRDEADALLEQFADDSVDEAMVSMLLGTGLRWGEMVGLQVGRLNLARNTVRVAEVWDVNQRVLKAYPKGKKIRDVPVPPWLAERLAPLVEGRKSGFVFIRNGFVPEYANWRRGEWLPALEGAGLGELRIHDLRHTYASWLIQDGVPLAEVGRLLGHVSPTTTQIYAHLADTPVEHIFTAIREVGRSGRVAERVADSRSTTLYEAV